MVHRYDMDLLDPISVQEKECGGGRPGRFRTKWTKSILRGNGWSSLWPVWDRPGRPNAAVFFKEPVENLVSDSALEAISGGSEYLVRHYVAPDISRREAAAPAGARYRPRLRPGLGAARSRKDGICVKGKGRQRVRKRMRTGRPGKEHGKDTEGEGRKTGIGKDGKRKTFEEKRIPWASAAKQGARRACLLFHV